MSYDLDADKCLGPLECGACVKRCSAAVFQVYTLNRVKGEVSDDVGIRAVRAAMCWGCGVCTDVCPTHAITI